MADFPCLPDHPLEWVARRGRGGTVKGHPDVAVDLHQLPVPFVGNPEKAPVVILALNPGNARDDRGMEQALPGFREALIGNLRGRPTDASWPFLNLRQEFRNHPGWTYWSDGHHFKSWHQRLQKDRGFGSEAAWQLIAETFCVCQLVPYHSVSFSDRLLRLPSAQAMRDWVHEVLIPRCRQGKQRVIVARSKAKWFPDKWLLDGIPDDRLHINGPGLVQRCSITPNAKAGPRRLIASALGLHA